MLSRIGNAISRALYGTTEQDNKDIDALLHLDGPVRDELCAAAARYQTTQNFSISFETYPWFQPSHSIQPVDTSSTSYEDQPSHIDVRKTLLRLEAHGALRKFCTAIRTFTRPTFFTTVVVEPAPGPRSTAPGTAKSEKREATKRRSLPPPLDFSLMQDEDFSGLPAPGRTHASLDAAAGGAPHPLYPLVKARFVEAKNFVAQGKVTVHAAAVSAEQNKNRVDWTLTSGSTEMHVTLAQEFATASLDEACKALKITNDMLDRLKILLEAIEVPKEEAEQLAQQVNACVEMTKAAHTLALQACELAFKGSYTKHVFEKIAPSVATLVAIETKATTLFSKGRAGTTVAGTAGPVFIPRLDFKRIGR